MKADSIWVVEPKKIEVRTVEVAEPGYGEVQIEAKACGVCAWDSYLYQCISAPGPAPYMIGHEAVGIVHKIGEGVTNLKPGDNVFCASGSNAMMCQYFNIKSSGVAKIPDDVTDYWKWVAEPTVCVVNLLHKTNIEPGDKVVLVGAGYMGLLTLQGLTRGSQAGEITVFEKRPEFLEMTKKYNPTFCYDPYSVEGKAHIDKIIAQGGADVVIDFAASDSGYELASSMTAKSEGKFVLGSWHRHKMSFDGTDWHMSGLTVLNLSPSSNHNFSEMIPRTAELIKKGVYNPGEFVTHVANYKDASKVFERSIDKADGYLKGVITF
jgi:threonine dehydrogenase-like Zn-dependent dehydrogenase